mgnify:CR=1 FL=1|jgi:hypothetical protein|tara:strand:- start:390 stop:632 length:243 start_codon:yes stop_codon:yes gene_type:complete
MGDYLQDSIQSMNDMYQTGVKEGERIAKMECEDTIKSLVDACKLSLEFAQDHFSDSMARRVAKMLSLAINKAEGGQDGME